MAQEIYIKVKVQDGEIDQTTNKLKKLGHEVETTFDSAGNSASNLQGGVEGIASEFQNVAKAAKTGGAAMRSAIVSTGIGALIVALGYVVENWQEIARFVGLTNESLEEQREKIEDSVKVLDSELKVLEAQEKLNKKLGISNQENLQKQKEILAEKRKLLEYDIKLLEAQLQKELSVNNELSLWQKIQIATGQAVAAATEDAERGKRIKELREKINNLKADVLEVDSLIFDINNPESPKVKRQKEQKLNVQTAEEAQAEQEKRRDQLNALFGVEDAFALKKIDLLKDRKLQEKVINAEAAEEERKNAEELAEAKIKIAEREFNNKQKLLGATSDGLKAFSKIAGEETAAGKALAVAASLINTYASIAGQLKAFSGVPIPGYAIAQAIATGAVGFASVKDILKVKVPGGDGGQGVGATPKGSTPPAFNVVGTSGVNQIAQTLGQDQNPIQAYVVGSNVTSQQALDRNIVETATIS